MVEVSTEELLLLLLYQRAPSSPRSVEASATEMADVLDTTGGTMAGRVEVVSAIHDLRSEGRLEVVDGTDAGGKRDRPAYRLTEDGAESAAGLRDSHESRTIELRDGETRRTVELGSIERYLEADGLVRALQGLSDDGVLWLGDEADRPSFVDREPELETALDLVESVTEGTARTLVVTGAAGIGKSEFVDRLFEDSPLRTVRRVASRDTDTPFGPFLDAFEWDESPFESRGGTVEDTEDFESLRSSLFSEVTERLERRAADEPLGVVVDDLQRADSATVALFEHLGAHLDGPVLLVAAIRSADAAADRLDGILNVEGCTRLDLDPFDRTTTARLVESVLGTTDVPGPFLDAVYESTGGNPLFVEESVDILRERGELDPRHGLYPDVDDGLPVSDRVESTIRERIDDLEDDPRTVLERCAVVGTEVPIDVLNEICDVSTFEIHDYLDVLVDRNVLERTDDRTVAFESDVVHTAVIGMLDDERRRWLHETIAEALASSPDHENRHARIASHYDEAGQPDQAIEHYRAAGRRATDVYAHDVARDRYERALELTRDLDRDEDVLELVTRIGHLAFVVGEFPEAMKYFEYARNNAEEDRIPVQNVVDTARIHNANGDFEEAIETVEAYLSEWRGDLDERAIGELLGVLGQAHQFRDEHDEAVRVYRDQRSLGRELGDRELEGRALCNLAGVQRRKGDPKRALETATESVETLEGTADQTARSRALATVGIAQVMVGNGDAAEETLRRSLDGYERIGQRVDATAVRTNLGDLYVRTGQFDRALEIFESEIERTRRLGNDRARAYAFHNAARIYRFRGAMATAKEYLERSRELVQTSGDRRLEVFVAADLSRWYYFADRTGDALAAADRAIDIAEDIEAPDVWAQGLRHRGTYHRSRGDLDAALGDHERGVELAGESDADSTIVDLDCALATTLAAADRAHDAIERAPEADRVERSDLAIQRPRVLRVLGACHRTLEEYDEALDRLEASLEAARELTSVVDECETVEELAAVHRERGDSEAARELFEEGLALATDRDIPLFERRFRDRIE